MKYIRTKAGKIYDIDDLYVCEELCGKPYGVKHSGWVIYRENIIQQANTIKELCDEFVYVGLDYPKVLDTHHDFRQIDTNQVLLNTTLHKDSCLFGAIWTDKGLIYVAKLNGQGELELL